jgi:hypothetical protein
MHDQTTMRTEGIAEQFRQHPQATAKADDGYCGLADEFPGQVEGPANEAQGRRAAR